MYNNNNKDLENDRIFYLEDKITILEDKITSLEEKISFIEYRLNKVIDSLAWWIPIKRWRDGFRNKFLDNFIRGGIKVEQY